jgi:hypothetical protein
MADAGSAGVPQSPETQSPDVREQLDQGSISHEGSARTGDDAETGTTAHLGAVETEVTPNMPPVRGPDDLVSPEQPGDSVIDPADEITPG